MSSNEFCHLLLLTWFPQNNISSSIIVKITQTIKSYTNEVTTDINVFHNQQKNNNETIPI